MKRYKCNDCMMMQDTGRVCGRCGSYNIAAMQTHKESAAPQSQNNQLPVASVSNIPVWFAIIGIAMLTSYLLIFHM